MAIVEMKHVDMLAMESDRQALLTAIQKMGCLQLTLADAEDVTFNRTAPPRKRLRRRRNSSSALLGLSAG